jgi:hypothetical protein
VLCHDGRAAATAIAHPLDATHLFTRAHSHSHTTDACMCLLALLLLLLLLLCLQRVSCESMLTKQRTRRHSTCNAPPRATCCPHMRPTDMRCLSMGVCRCENARASVRVGHVSVRLNLE